MTTKHQKTLQTDEKGYNSKFSNYLADELRIIEAKRTKLTRKIEKLTKKLAKMDIERSQIIKAI